MKKYLLLIILWLPLSLMAQPDSIGNQVPLMNDQNDSLSYFLGLGLGYELQNPPFEGNPELILRGFTEAFSNQAPVDPDTARMVFQQLQIALQAEDAREAEEASAAAMAEGQRFLAENGKREGIITTASGLQYEVLVKGEGGQPADSSEVEVHYEGTLTDGTVFDSSYERGEPVSFPLNRVIAGWTEGVQLMPVGSTYRFYIPSELGYGERGTGPIPPHSVLIFKIELLEIKGQ